MDIKSKEKVQKGKQRLRKNDQSAVLDQGDMNISIDSAFVQSIVKKKMKETQNLNSIVNNSEMVESDPDHLNLDRSSIIHDSQGFTTVVRDKGVNRSSINRTPEECCKRGFDFILSNEKFQAIQDLSKAIEFHPTDTRHFINRSYCYLTTGQYSSAIDDIHRILAHIDDPMQLSKLKCREAQAHWGMQNYERADGCFRDSLNFIPNCAAVNCEWMRMKIAELVSFGFSERKVLQLFDINPKIAIKDAVTFLCTFANDEPDEDSQSDEAENDVYHSDCDDFPSNTRLFMNIVGFDDANEDDSWRENPRTEKNSDNMRRRVTKPSTTTNEMKVINATGFSKPLPKQTTRNPPVKSVWVGGINPRITESILMKYFSKFGKVSSVYMRSPRYAFVNFHDVSSAQKALDALTLKIGDAELTIKPGKKLNWVE